MCKKMRFPLIALISAAILLSTGACTRQIAQATPLTSTAIPTLAILLKGTPTEAVFPSAAPSIPSVASSPVPTSATGELPTQAIGTPAPAPLSTGQPQEAETPLVFTATPTEYVINPNITPEAGNAANTTILGKHLVQNYDSLESIARAYDVDPNAIKSANNLTSDAITPGTTLIIPAVKWVNVTAGPISIPQFPTLYQNAGFSK